MTSAALAFAYGIDLWALVIDNRSIDIHLCTIWLQQTQCTPVIPQWKSHSGKLLDGTNLL